MSEQQQNEPHDYRIQAMAPRSLARRIRIVAATTDRTFPDVVRDAVTEHLKKFESDQETE
jgi:hypothetical protein